MKNILLVLLAVFLIATPASAEMIAPEVPQSGAELMPESESFSEGLLQIFQNVLPLLRPDLVEACRVGISLIAAAMILGILSSVADSNAFVADCAGAAVVSSVLLLSTNSLIRLGSETIQELTEYGKLLLPIMTGALAAQGGVTTSAALYLGTTAFTTFLSNLISRLLLPGVYLVLALSIAGAATGEKALKNMHDMAKGLISWILKTILTVFTTYMGITGVVSGTTDAAALKATKVTIASFVPVVGSILSDASEAVLVSAGLAKNAAGIYGILAILAVFLHPFLQIGIHYLLLKACSALCSLFGTKRMTELIGEFSSAMWLLLGMTGSVCLMLLISTVCFLKGVG